MAILASDWVPIPPVVCTGCGWKDVRDPGAIGRLPANQFFVELRRRVTADPCPNCGEQVEFSRGE